MFDKLAAVESRFEEICAKMSDPDVINDAGGFKALMKEHSRLEPIVDKYREYKEAVSRRDGAEEMLGSKGLDPELHELALEELAEAKAAAESAAE